MTARVAWNYTSSDVDAVDGIVPNVVVAPVRRVDVSTRVRIGPNFLVYLQAQNLRRQSEVWYDGNPNLPKRFFYDGRTFIGGAQLHF